MRAISSVHHYRMRAISGVFCNSMRAIGDGIFNNLFLGNISSKDFLEESVCFYFLSFFCYIILKVLIEAF